MFEGAPWSLRLACKLLREKAKGSASPYHPYLQVLLMLPLQQSSADQGSECIILTQCMISQHVITSSAWEHMPCLPLPFQT